ncbi:hypothetical protein C0W50_03740 [Photobacterium leiognathi subsp. mandapamensis]|nr:hypothetical protein C0W50_03740 [Photobacterium leiognathi subsp. mandapamensis]
MHQPPGKIPTVTKLIMRIEMHLRKGQLPNLDSDGVLRAKLESGRGGNRKTSRVKRSTNNVQRSAKKKR